MRLPGGNETHPISIPYFTTARPSRHRCSAEKTRIISKDNNNILDRIDPVVQELRDKVFSEFYSDLHEVRQAQKPTILGNHVASIH